MERVQTLSRGAAVFKERCCRVSYGVLCLDEYNPSNPAHIGQKVTLDPRDGKKWVENQIDWFVKQVRIRTGTGRTQLANFCHRQGGECLDRRRSETIRNEDKARERRTTMADSRCDVDRGEYHFGTFRLAE
jgi:hypothetical protein